MSSSRPTVLILAAGENSRFFPFNTSQHKGSLELLGEPLIVRTLRNLEEQGFENVVIVVSEKDYGGKGLSEALHRQNQKLKISFVLQSKALGMGNAVLSAKELLGEQFAVVFPNLFDAGVVVSELMKYAGKDGALAVSMTDEPWLYGIVTVEGKRVMSIVEKPAKGSEPSNMKAQGIYLLPKSFLEVLEKTPEAQYSFETAQDAFFKDHEVNAVELKDSLPALKYPWHLFDTQNMLFESMKSSTDQSAVVAPTAVIDDSKGPVIIRAGARVGHAAKIVGPCFIGENVSGLVKGWGEFLSE